MRCALNTLQSIQLITTKIDEDIVYKVMGYPHPKDIEDIISCCLTMPLTKSFQIINEIKLNRGLTLLDVLREIIPQLSKLKLTIPAIMDLLETFAEIEQRLAYGADEKIQLASCIGALVLAKNVINSYE